MMTAFKRSRLAVLSTNSSAFVPEDSRDLGPLIHVHIFLCALDLPAHCHRMS
jgi:hypothetical protein